MVKIQYNNETNTVIMSQATARDVANFIIGYEAGFKEAMENLSRESLMQNMGYKSGISKRDFSEEAKIVWESIELQKSFGCSEIPQDNQKFIATVKAKIKELVNIDL